MDKAIKLLQETLAEVKSMSIHDYERLYDDVISNDTPSFSFYCISDGVDINYIEFVGTTSLSATLYNSLQQEKSQYKYRVRPFMPIYSGDCFDVTAA